MGNKVALAKPAVSFGSRSRGLGQGGDNTCRLAVEGFQAAEVTPVGDGTKLGFRHRGFGLCCHVGGLVAVMPDIRDFMGDDQVMFGADGNLDIVTDHPRAPAAGRH